MWVTLAWAASCALPTLAAADTQALERCRAIDDDRQRLACYDAAVANPSPASPALVGAGTASSATEAPARKSSGEDDFGKQKTDAEKEAPQELQARVASVRTDSVGKLVLGLDNGQTWAQIDSSSLKLRSGDQIVIRRGTLGSYLLARVGGGTEIRVRRK